MNVSTPGSCAVPRLGCDSGKGKETRAVLNDFEARPFRFDC